MAASYYLKCLGTPELRGPDGHPVKFRTRKHFALFIYLAVEPPQAHRRDRLAEMFWPRVSEPEARHSLATAVSTFRKKLGPRAVQADRDHLQLGLAGLELDLARLERGEVLGDEFSPPLDIANFLDQFEPSDSAGFLHWRDRHQARLFPAIRESLLKLIDRCRRTGNFRQIEVLADRLLGIDHLSEDGIRAKMEARAFDGDRLSALKLYEEWRERLQGELGAMPSPIVEGIATRLRRRGLERTTGNEIPTVPTDQWKGHRFVGRSREYRLLYESWERTARKDSTSALVLGDSGVGKTTLADRLTTAAGLEGASAVRTQCYEADREIPYAALSGLVRGLLDRPGASCTRTGALADLATCIGEVRQRFPSLPGVEPLQGEAVRVRLAEAAHELVSAVAEEGPVILVVDDVHLADDASIAVIHQLLRRAREQPIMVVLTARPTELDRSPSARRLRENAPSLGVTTIEVPPMTDEECRELLGALVEGAGAAPTLAERRALLGAAGGFPMVLELLVRDWLADGRNALALTFNSMTTDPARGSRAEHAYRALIERLILDLPPDVRNVLNLAAILGNRLNDLEMYGLVDLTLARTMTGMTTLTDLRLLRDNGKEIGFRNELIRAQAYMDLPSTLRRALHSRVADRLIAGQTDRPVTGLELAWHCFRGGRPEEGQDYLISGSREAIDGGAVCEAELALTSALGSLSGSRRSSGLLLLAESLNDQSRWGDSLVTLQLLRHSELDGHSNRLHVLRSVAEWHSGVYDSAATSRTLTQLGNLARTEERLDICIAAVHAATTILSDDFSLHRAREFLQVCRDLSERLPTNSQKALIAVEEMALSHFSGLQSESARIEGLVAQAIDSGLLHTASATVAGVNLCLGSRRIADGDYEGGLPFFRRAFDTSGNLGNRKLLARSAGNVALCHDRMGDFDESINWAQVGLDSAGRWKDPFRFKLFHLIAWALAMKGDPSAAIKVLGRKKDFDSNSNAEWVGQVSLLLESDLLWALGRQKSSDECALRATSGSNAALLTPFYAGPFCRALARAGVSVGREREYLERIQHLLSNAGRLDAIDNADIYAAQLLLSMRLGIDFGELPSRLIRSLARLPAAMHPRLTKLGFAAALECAASAPK